MHVQYDAQGPRRDKALQMIVQVDESEFIRNSLASGGTAQLTPVLTGAHPAANVSDCGQ